MERGQPAGARGASVTCKHRVSPTTAPLGLDRPCCLCPWSAEHQGWALDRAHGRRLRPAVGLEHPPLWASPQTALQDQGTHTERGLHRQAGRAPRGDGSRVPGAGSAELQSISCCEHSKFIKQLPRVGGWTPTPQRFPDGQRAPLAAFWLPKALLARSLSQAFVGSV